MKQNKLLAAFLAALLLLSTAGCGSKGPQAEDGPNPTESSAPTGLEPSSGQSEAPGGTEWPAVQLAETAFAYSGSAAGIDIDRISLEENADDAAYYIEHAYDLDIGLLEDFAVVRGVGASALELAALTLRDTAGSDTVMDALRKYIPLRQADFTGYNPAEAEMVSQSSLLSSGKYVCLFVCPEPDIASAAVNALLTGGEMPQLPEPAESPAPSETPAPSGASAPSETLAPSEASSPSETPAPAETPAPPNPARVTVPTMRPMVYWSIGDGPRDPNYPNRLAFSPPNDEDMSIYDTSAILAAWESGDASALSEKDLATLDAARDILDSALVEDMTTLEKEIALYHWCVQAFDYDYSIQNAMAETPRESFEPYGGLVSHKTVCLGSATSFQLLMDLAGVECITVIGADDSNRGDHAWNMVKLYGNWYCVDVGWDSNLREDGNNSEWEWSFFNVTSDYLASCLHQWDYANTPEATTPGNGMY